MTLLPPIEDRDLWHAARREGVGGSEVAAICGLSHFAGATALGVYLEKVGLVDPSPETEPMRWGTLLEAPIVREFTHRTGLYVGAEQWRAVDVERPWRRSTIDGLVFEHPIGPYLAEKAPGRTSSALTLGLLEVKTTGDREWDELPDGYALQCQWSMGLLGLDRAWLAVLFRGQRLEVHELTFEPDMFAALGRIVDRFWHDHVLAGVPPDPTDRDLDAVKAAWRTRVDADKTIAATPELVAVARDWLDAGELRRAVEAREDELEARLRLALGDALALELDGDLLLTLKPQNTPARIDERALRATHPRAAARFTKPAGTTRVLRATKALKTQHEGAS